MVMCFVSAGKPEPLVFHIPQAFFNSLQHRLSLGSKKRRLPNATSGEDGERIWHTPVDSMLHLSLVFPPSLHPSLSHSLSLSLSQKS